MLSGKDVYEAARPFLQNMGLEGTEWEEGDFGQGTQAFYNAIAEKLNAQFIAPLEKRIQKQSKSHIDSEIETLHDAFAVIDDFHSQITNLKTLVRGYIELVEQRIGTVNQIPPAGWSDRACELERRAQQLLGEEPAKP